MINSPDSLSTNGRQNELRDTSANKEPEDWEREYQQSLSLFDFSSPLPEKKDGHFRFFYNNCNGLEINHTVQAYLKQQRDKTKHKYIQDVETPTKVDNLLRQMKVWQVDVVSLGT